MTPHPSSARKTGDGGRGLIKRPELLAQQLTLRGGELHIQCDWHLYFCTDFTRSVPLDSQSGTSLSRRSRSSPNGLSLYNIFIKFVLIRLKTEKLLVNVVWLKRVLEDQKFVIQELKIGASDQSNKISPVIEKDHINRNFNT